MSIIQVVFGVGKDLGSFQMMARAAAIFIATLAFIRIAGRRSFGQRSPFDYVVAILLGATLSRVIVGASPAIPTAAASLTLVVLHRLIAWACVHSRGFERFITGGERELFRDGKFDEHQMNAALVTRTDVIETVRKELGAVNLDRVKAVFLERNGEISLIRFKSD